MNQSRLNGRINRIEERRDVNGAIFFRLNIILDGGRLFYVHPNQGCLHPIPRCGVSFWCI